MKFLLSTTKKFWISYEMFSLLVKFSDLSYVSLIQASSAIIVCEQPLLNRN